MFGSIKPGKQARGAAAIGIVFGAELRAQHSLFGADAGEERREHEGGEEDADRRSKCQRPAQRVDEQPQIARVADDAIDAARDQLVPGLDRDQPAEAMAEHKDRPEPQRSASREKEDTEPADGVAVECPEFFAVGVGRQIAGQ